VIDQRGAVRLTTTAVDPDRTPPWILPPFLIAAVLVGAFTAFAPGIFNDGDTWMHIAAGDLMLRSGAVVHTDPFSYTFLGKPWQAHEWLSEVLMALAWRLAGWTGVALLFATAAGAMAGLLTRHVGRWLGGVPLAVVVVLSLGCLAPALLARPHLLALPLLEMWTAELVMARADGRPPSWIRLAPIMVAWANIHGSFVFGLGLLGAFGLESAWRNRSEGVRALLPWAWPVPLMLVATVVSPHGLANLTFPLRLTSMTTLAGIGEWAPLDFDRNPFFEVALLGLVLVLGWRGVRVPVFSLLLVLLVAHLTLHHARHVQLFAIVAPLLLAEPLGAVFKGKTATPGRGGPWPIAAAAALAAVVAVGRIAVASGSPDSASAPSVALAHVPPSLKERPVFNAYRFGGFLIFSGVRPYIDSRAEVYGDAFRNRFLALQGGDACAFAAEAAKRGFAWTILEPASPLIPALDRSPDWRRLYADSHAIVHVHQGGAWTRPPGCSAEQNSMTGTP
jgi:hypothetical protein